MVTGHVLHEGSHDWAQPVGVELPHSMKGKVPILIPARIENMVLVVDHAQTMTTRKDKVGPFHPMVTYLETPGLSVPGIPLSRESADSVCAPDVP